MGRTKAELEAEIKHLRSQVAQLHACVAEGSVIGQRIGALLDNAPILVWTTNRELRVVEVSGGLRNIAMIGSPMAEILLPSAIGADALAAAGAALEGSTAAFRARVDEAEVAGWVTPLYTSSARIIGVSGIAMDESARRRAEQDLATVHERCRTLLDDAHEILCLHDFHGVISTIEGPLHRVFGYSMEEAAGMKFSDLLAPESRAVASAWIQAISVSFAPRSWESVGLTKAGKKIPLEIRARLLAQEGRAHCIQAIARDLSADKGVQSFRGGAEHIARDLNGLLAAVSRDASLDAESCERALRLSSQLLALATGENMSVDVHRTVQQIAASLQRNAGRRIRIGVDLHARNSLVLGDEVQLHELLLAACSDACAAVPRGSELLISSSDAAGSILVTISYVGVKNQPQRTEFRLPVARLTAELLSPAAAQPVPGSGTILVIDEEEVVRRVLSRMVKDLGYDAVGRGLADAVDLFRADHRSIALVIAPSDVDLQSFRSIHPDVRAVVCGREGDGRPPGFEFLQKPYSLESLAAVMRRALTRTAVP